MNDIENCLNVEKSENVDHKTAQNQESIEKYLSYYRTDETIYLTDDMMFKIILICLMKISKMQMKEVNEVHDITAFVLAIFSQLLQFVVMKLQESLLDMSMLNNDYEVNKMNNVNEICENANNTAGIGEKNHNFNYSENKDAQDSNESKSRDDNKNIEMNGNHINGRRKKSRGKSESLLTKLRRPRNRKNSSDSDISDREGAVLGSSSEDVNSDITETEDVGSDENALSDEALSDDLTDDERFSCRGKNLDDKDTATKQANGHANTEEKYVEENENDNEVNVNAAAINKEADVGTNNVESNLNSTYDDNSTSANTLTYVAQMEKQNLDPIKVLNVLNEERMLISIKICCDWLQGHQDIIKICAKGSKPLLKRLVTLLNLINLDSNDLLKKWDRDLEILSCSEKTGEILETVPLPEDIDVKGLKLFEHVHRNLDWEILTRKKITTCEETLLRALKIVKFGHHLCSVQESGVLYENNKGLFVVSDQENNTSKENPVHKNVELDHSRGKLMRHMGKLWLKAEVRALESRMHYRLMSPYLVPDHEAFSKFMPLLKHLVYAKKFIVVIPSVGKINHNKIYQTIVIGMFILIYNYCSCFGIG